MGVRFTVPETLPTCREGPHLSTSEAPVRRVDAERNREKILAAARAAFGDPDADVSMAEVARRAGIGSATLYRNFANRRELLEALYVDEIDAVCEAAAAGAGDTPGERLTEWLRRFYAYFISKRFVAAELLEQTDSEDPVFATGFTRVLAAADPLAAAARQSGEIRPDLTLDQILALVVAVAKIPGDSGYREPILQAALDALAPSAQPGSGPDDDVGVAHVDAGEDGSVNRRRIGADARA